MDFNLNKQIINTVSSTIMHPKGSIHEPMILKCRKIANKYNSLIISIPSEISQLIDVKPGQEFFIYCDVKNNRIIMDKLLRA